MSAVPVTNAFGATSFNSARSTKTRPSSPNSACWRCRNRSTASTGNCPISPATTTCIHAGSDRRLLINGIASDITRNTYTNGIQGDGSYQLNSAHTLRTGFTVSAEQAFVGNSSLVEPCTPATAPTTARRRHHQQRLESSAGSMGSMFRTSGRSPTSSP
jgi:hypothetical protein